MARAVHACEIQSDGTATSCQAIERAADLTGFCVIRRRVHDFADPQAGAGSPSPSNDAGSRGIAGSHFAGLQSLPMIDFPSKCFLQTKKKAASWTTEEKMV